MLSVEVKSAVGRDLRGTLARTKTQGRRLCAHNQPTKACPEQKEPQIINWINEDWTAFKSSFSGLPLIVE